MAVRDLQVWRRWMILVAILVGSCGGKVESSRVPEQSVADSGIARKSGDSGRAAGRAEEQQSAKLSRIGIDVSHHSGDIDWKEGLGEGYHFVYVKATEGLDAADPMFEQHWTALKELEIPRGACHFYVTEDDPEEQARFFLSRIKDDPGELVPVVDIELVGHGTSGGLAPGLRRFLEIVEQRTGAKPAIYTSPNFWDEHLDDSFGAHPLWIAEYEVDVPRVPAGWNDYTLWQYAGAGRCRASPGTLT